LELRKEALTDYLQVQDKTFQKLTQVFSETKSYLLLIITILS
jgi:hypothetical protein